jgi:hypothetical protein
MSDLEIREIFAPMNSVMIEYGKEEEKGKKGGGERGTLS